MSAPTRPASPDPRLERLAALLPAIVRIRDEAQGRPLQQLLALIAAQVNALEDANRQLYDNWFIETAQDWAVPYIGELVGYTPVHDAGGHGPGRADLGRVLSPRREVANTIRARRRKGTLPLLENLAADVSGWPARAAEFGRAVVAAQHVNHRRPTRGRSVDVRLGEALDLLGTPFDPFAHVVDVRRIQSPHRQGRFNLPSVGLYLWRLRAFPVTHAPAACLEEVAPSCYTFSVLGNDAPLYTRPLPEPSGDHIAAELNLPLPIRRRALARHLRAYYGEGRSLMIYRGQKSGRRIDHVPVGRKELVVADLSGWDTPLRVGQVAVDPQLGRLTFHPRDRVAGVWVSYYAGFSAGLGGGEYRRAPRPRPAPNTYWQAVGKRGQVSTVEQAVRAWEKVRERQPHGVLEISDSELYAEQLNVTLHPGEHLEIRAAPGTRPVLYLLDRERNLPDALSVFGVDAPVTPPAAGPPSPPAPRCLGRLTLDGLLITGRAVHVEGALSAVCLRHCTLVPGWGLQGDCTPQNPAKPSLELYQTNAQVRIQHSIVGSIQVYQDEVKADPCEIHIEHSVVDATAPSREAIGAPNWPRAHATVTLRSCTVFGKVQVHAIALAENSIFTGQIQVARRQVGCLRFCAVIPGSRTPRRYHCQPDLAQQPLRAQAGWDALPLAEQERQLALAHLRVQPQFDSLRYGTPTYARLSLNGPEEIRRGADDESELGAFHDLYQPHRLGNLNARMNEYTPARTDVGVIFAD